MKKLTCPFFFFFKLQISNFKFFFLFFAFFVSTFSLFSQPKIQLVDFSTGFTQPVDIAHCGDSRLFVVEKRGYIWITDSLGNRLQDPFLNIDDRVLSVQSERGLLGLAFPPDYAQTGYFYVNYSRETDGDTRVSRFSRNPLDPNKADPNSELIILTQDQPFANHNGGGLKFGLDGYLYIALGDGGSGDDPQNNGQKKTTFLGKILRIDVSSAPYVVPPDNPFVGDASYLPEIWSLGLRNPWRFSFDRLTGDMWIGDVGQSTREEIDFEPFDTGGRNYGWRCYEGVNAYITGGCAGASNYVGPVFDYDNNSMGCSVTGGFRYRGSQYPDLYGKYIFTDYCSGRWWVIQPNADGSFTTTQIADLSNSQYCSLGEDRDGELYVALLGNGKIQKITELCSGFQLTGGVTQQNYCTGTFNGVIEVQTSGGATPVNYEWSNGQSGSNIIIYLEAGLYSVTATDANGCARIDTFEMTNQFPDPPAPVITAPAMEICEGDTLALTSSEAPDGYSYQWYAGGTPIPGATGQTLEIYSGGVFHIVFEGMLCSSVSEEIQIATATLVPPPILVSGDTLMAVTFNNYTFQWYLNGQPIPGANEKTYIAEVSGNYSLEVGDDNGCRSFTEEIYVDISLVKLPPSVRSFSLAPNPTQNTVLLTLELEKTERVTLSLSDVQQKQIFMQTQQNQKIVLPIDLRALPVGTYYLTVQMESGRIVRKVVKV